MILQINVLTKLYPLYHICPLIKGSYPLCILIDSNWIPRRNYFGECSNCLKQHIWSIFIPCLSVLGLDLFFSYHCFLCVRTRATLNLFLERGNPLKVVPLQTENWSPFALHRLFVQKITWHRHMLINHDRIKPPKWLNRSFWSLLIWPYPARLKICWVTWPHCHVIVTWPCHCGCWDTKWLCRDKLFKCTFKHSGQNQRFVVPCDLEKNGAPLLWYFKLCVSFRSHWWIQTEVTVRKRPIWVKIDFFSHVTMKFDGSPCKTKRNIFYDTSSLVYHYVAIDESKLELQSGNAHFGSKSTIFEAQELEIWQTTTKNHMAAPLCYFKFCAAFRSHWWI